MNERLPMKRFLVLGLLFAAAGILPAAPRQPKDASRPPKQQENRFLFIVDTSSAMGSYSNAVVQDVGQLLASNMKGEFREGDTFGLWVYNDTLHPEYPMQVWSKDEKPTLMNDVEAFLRTRHYQKRAHLDKVMPALRYVIKNSERITIILVFDGVEMVHGTPFDSEINDLQKAYARELRAAHEPFVIVFAARDGVIYDYTINYPGVIAIPHTAVPEKPAETNAPVAAAVVETNVPPVIKIGPSRIMSGSKVIHPVAPAPAPATDTAAVVVVPPPVQPVAATVAVSVPAPVPVVVNTPESAPVAPLIQQPKTAIAPPPVVATVAVPVSQPAVAAAPPPATDIVPAQLQPAPPPVLARQNPESANETLRPAAKPASDEVVTTKVIVKDPQVAAASSSGTTQLVLFVAALLLVVIALGMVVFVFRRSRPATQPSLISQSIDRPR